MAGRKSEEMKGDGVEHGNVKGDGVENQKVNGDGVELKHDVAT